MISRRWLNIVVRTTHIASMAVLVGGHAFDVAPARLLPCLWLTLATGATLLAIESGARPIWLREGRGLLTVAKLALICAVPFAWDARLPLLVATIVLASVGSHMPSRYRHWLAFGGGDGVDRH